MSLRKKKECETYKAVIVNGENVLLFGNQEAKAATSRVLEGNAADPGSKNPIHIIPVIQLIVKTFGDPDRFGGIPILDNDEVVRLKEGPPHRQEIQVPDGGDNNVQIIFQRW